MKTSKFDLRNSTFVLLLGLFLVPAARGQVSPSFYDYARPTLDWYTIETEHFSIVFHADAEGQGSSRTAQVVARIAEDVYRPITSLYGHEPNSKVSIILKDFEDYSNGAAYFFDNKIEIWAPALDTPLRGEHNWLRNVITHEFTHIVQVQTTMKAGRGLPFLYFQLLDYEDVRRPDVLYGYPNVIITYPIPTLNNPAWLAEGTAQYQRAWLDYDRWDTHRDMLLRTRVLAGEELSLAEMGSFYSKSSLMREGVYNHGYAFTHYLANTYGEEALRDVSRALGRWRNWNVERALEDALGVPAKDVYTDWMHAMRQEYQARTEAIRAHRVEGELLEPEGFSNFYPTFSPDGAKLAYVSNRGEHFNRMSLYVHDLASGDLAAYEVDGMATALREHTCAFGHRLRAGVGGGISWRPDGAALVYARHRDTPEGFSFSDLYELDLATKQERRLTRERRAALPAYATDGSRIAYVGQSDGTTNLFTFDPATEDVVRLTTFEDGSQVSDPAWHPSGEWIYFALLGPESHGLDLWRIRPDGSQAEAVYATEADERSPAFDMDGSTLYFSSDASGIFNLYRVPVSGGRGQPPVGTRHAVSQRPGDGATVPERITNVLGGAFMPAVSGAGALAYAQYQWDGYKIAWFDAIPTLPEDARVADYVPPSVTQKQSNLALADEAWTQLNRFDDGDLRALEESAVTAVRTEGRFPLNIKRPDAAVPVPSEDGEPLEIEKYNAKFTGFGFYPVLRLDQYVSRRRTVLDRRLPDRTRGETLLRNLKVGTYMASREILEGLTLFGGLLIGPGTQDADSFGDFFAPARLLKLERDAFLLFEYKKGLGIIPERWSPQFSVELFNIRRRVDNGLALEEFPCTACFPDTTLADLSYSLWEADFYARSKVNRNLLLELGYRYSPYRVTTGQFFSKEEQTLIPESSSRYFIGRAFSARAYFEALYPYRESDVLPVGLRLLLGYDNERGRLLDRFDVENGLLVPVYDRAQVHRLTFEAKYGLRLPGRVRGAAHGLNVRLRTSSILGATVDDFYNDYIGGLVGARGYPFYALGGNETVWFQAAYHLPLLPDVRKQLLFAYIDKVYARFYVDAAAAWNGAWPGFGAVRKDVGAEVRMKMNSFYLLPSAVFLSATYGLDAFDFQLDEGFVTPDGSDTVRYGSELQWHFGVLFEFDL